MKTTLLTTTAPHIEIEAHEDPALQRVFVPQGVAELDARGTHDLIAALSSHGSELEGADDTPLTVTLPRRAWDALERTIDLDRVPDVDDDTAARDARYAADELRTMLGLVQ